MQNQVVSIVSIEPRLLTVRQAAAYLGATVWFVRTLAWSRNIPHLILGKRMVFDKADLDRYVDSLKVCGTKTVDVNLRRKRR